MGLADDIKKDTQQIFASQWSTRDGNVVPDSEDLKLGNDAVKLEAVVLYADLADSTSLVDSKQRWFAAEMYKAYLNAACKIIRAHDGVITAFDGDRVMGVFIGNRKNTEAAIAGLQINHAVTKILNLMIAQRYPDQSFSIRQAVGIDSGDIFAARTGIRGANDIVWVGPAANYAAKLCGLRDGEFNTWITYRVFNNMRDEAKYGGAENRLMWETRTWTKYNMTVYRSNWTWVVN